MNDLNVIIVVFLSLLLGIICLAATANGWAYSRKAGYIVAAGFLIFGAVFGFACVMKADLLLVFVIAVTFGGFQIAMGLSMLADCLIYRKRGEGQFIKAAYSGMERSTEYYRIVVRFMADGKVMERASEDHYTESYIKKHMRETDACTIWQNPKNPERFRIRRFEGLVPGILVSFLGFIFFSIPFELLLERI